MQDLGILKTTSKVICKHNKYYPVESIYSNPNISSVVQIFLRTIDKTPL